MYIKKVVSTIYFFYFLVLSILILISFIFCVSSFKLLLKAGERVYTIMNLFLLSLQWPNLQVCALADKLFWNEKRGTCENGAQKISGWIDHGWCHGFPTVFDSLGPRKSFEQSKTWKKIFFSTFQNLLSVDFPLVYDMIILNGHPFSISFGLVRK